jgi:ketosteroid isomerase-like protein
MPKIPAIAVLAAMLLPATGAQAQQTRPADRAVEQELIALDEKFDQARRQGDMSAVADVLADDFVQVIGTGVRTQAEYLKVLASAKPVPPGDPEPPAPSYAVRVHGDTAILTHVIRRTDPHDPAPANGVMHVFARQQGRWKMIGWSSVLAPPSPELSINGAGYELMASGKLKEATELFRLNVRLFPESWNVHDSLGEALAAAGDTTAAIENYEKSLQLNPKNDTGKAALAKLRGK